MRFAGDKLTDHYQTDKMVITRAPRPLARAKQWYKIE